jgi:hypothetical protein
MIWLLYFALTAPLTLFLHEASHAAVVKLRGGTIDMFRPWPGKINGKWWFGYVMYQKPSLERDTRWRHGSPLLVSAPLAIALGVGSLWWPPLLAWSIWEAIDFANWWKGYFGIRIPFTGRWAHPPERYDGYKFRYFKK